MLWWLAGWCMKWMIEVQQLCFLCLVDHVHVVAECASLQDALGMLYLHGLVASLRVLVSVIRLGLCFLPHSLQLSCLIQVLYVCTVKALEEAHYTPHETLLGNMNACPNLGDIVTLEASTCGGPSVLKTITKGWEVQ